MLINDIKENECGYDWLPGTFSVAKICLTGHLSTDICRHNAVSPTCQQGASSGCVSLLYRDNIQPPCLILAQWWNDKIIGFIKIPGTFGPHTMTGLTIVWPSRKKEEMWIDIWHLHFYLLCMTSLLLAYIKFMIFCKWSKCTYGELTHDWFCPSI